MYSVGSRGWNEGSSRAAVVGGWEGGRDNNSNSSQWTESKEVRGRQLAGAAAAREREERKAATAAT